MESLFFSIYSNFEGDAETLDLGQEVQYTMSGKTPPSGKISAENVKLLKKGTIPGHKLEDEIFEGIVTRPLRNVNPDQAQYAGLVKLGADSKSNVSSTAFTSS